MRRVGEWSNSILFGSGGGIRRPMRFGLAGGPHHPQAVVPVETVYPEGQAEIRTLVVPALGFFKLLYRLRFNYDLHENVPSAQKSSGVLIAQNVNTKTILLGWLVPQVVE